MIDAPSDYLRRRNEIIGATLDGLELRIDGRVEAVSWSTVTGVSAGQAKLNRTSDIWVLVLAVEVRLREREHILILGEVDRAWLPLTSLLHKVLPAIAPFERWASSVLTASTPVELYAQTNACVGEDGGRRNGPERH